MVLAQTGNLTLDKFALSLPYFVGLFLLWLLGLYMYAAVADLRSLMRSLRSVILILFMQFQRQAYRCVRSGIHILNRFYLNQCLVLHR